MAPHMLAEYGRRFRIAAFHDDFTKFPSQRPVTRSFDISLIFALNKRLSKQSWGWWFETPLCSLWCHCNASPVSSHCPTPRGTHVTQADLVRNGRLVNLAAAQIGRFTWPTWGPPGSCWPQVGPMRAQWTLLSGWYNWAALTSTVTRWLTGEMVHHIGICESKAADGFSAFHVNLVNICKIMYSK